jgi:hypothetical protein
MSNVKCRQTGKIGKAILLRRLRRNRLSRCGWKVDRRYKALRSAPAFGRGTTSVSVGMSDPRNVAHNKKITQEKHHQEAKPAAHAGRKPRKEMTSPDARENQPAETAPTPARTEDAKEKQHQPGDLEKSLAVLAKLKDLEFHSRANIEALAQLSLTVEEELKQREFSEAIGALYSAQDAFHSKIAAFIKTYQVKCESLKQPA